MFRRLVFVGLLFLLTTHLHAMSTKAIQESFRQSISNANDIIKRGEYAKLPEYQRDIESLRVAITNSQMTQAEKDALQKDLQTYLKLVNEITFALQQNAPRLSLHYNDTIKGLKNFNQKIASIGLSDLTTQWMRLSRLKNSFIKKPNKRLEKEFNDTYNSVIVTIRELYLDEEIEAPMLAYLESYQNYFSQIALSYKSVNYNTITNIKPLCYKIKAQLELATSQES